MILICFDDYTRIVGCPLSVWESGQDLLCFVLAYDVDYKLDRPRDLWFVCRVLRRGDIDPHVREAFHRQQILSGTVLTPPALIEGVFPIT